MRVQTKKVGRYREGEETRERILHAALSLISENGYSATSVSAIGQAAGVRVNSIYWAFGSKEGLLAAVMERMAEVGIAAVFDVAEEEDPNDMWQVVRNWTTRISQRPEFLRLLLILSLERSEGDPEILLAARRIREHARQMFAVRLEQLIPLEDTVRSRAMAQELTQLIMLLLDGVFVSRQIEPGEQSDEQLVQGVRRAVRASLNEMIAEVGQ